MQSKPKSVSKPTVATSLYVKVKYNNTLPDIPSDPKFLVNPLNLARYVDYTTTSLEQNAKHELLTPSDLGVDIDLILNDRYKSQQTVLLDPEDHALVHDENTSADKSKKKGEGVHTLLHNKVVPWLKKTEYISTEYNRYGSSNEKTETKVGYNVRKSLKEDDVFLDKDSQIKAINATFESAQSSIDEHPTKPNVYAEKVSPLLPDFDIAKHFFAHVKFDSEPADPSKVDQVSQAIMKGARDEETNENFVVYFLPTEITMTDRLLDQENGLDYTEGKEYEYQSTREYSWQAKSNLKDDFFLISRDDGVYYTSISMEVALKKRRSKNPTSSKLVVRHREHGEDEFRSEEQKVQSGEDSHEDSQEDSQDDSQDE